MLGRSRTSRAVEIHVAGIMGTLYDIHARMNQSPILLRVQVQTHGKFGLDQTPTPWLGKKRAIILWMILTVLQVR